MGRWGTASTSDTREVYDPDIGTTFLLFQVLYDAALSKNKWSLIKVVSIGLFWIILCPFRTMEYKTEGFLFYVLRCSKWHYSPAQRNVTFILH